MLTKSKAISAKGSPTSMSATHFKNSMGSFPLTTTSCQTKDTQFPQFSINIQAALPQDTPQPSVDTSVSKQLSLSSSLQPTTPFVGLLDRHTFYAADFSLFGPKAFHRKSLTESSYLHSSTPKKSQLNRITLEDESKKIQEESFENGIRLDKPLYTDLSEFKVSVNSTKSSKSQSTLRSKKLDSNSISRTNATPMRVNRPVTTKHTSNKSVIVFPSPNDGLQSAKNSTQTGKPIGYSPSEKMTSSLNKKLSLNQPGFEVLDPSLTRSTPVSYILASKGETRTPSNAIKVQQPEPSHFDKKAIKKSKRIENKNSRFSLDNYQKLGKSSGDFAGKPNNLVDASPHKGTPKSHMKPKNLSVSQAPTQPVVGKLNMQKTNQGLFLRNVSDLDETLNIEVLDKIIHEEDIDGSDHKIKANGDEKRLGLDGMQSYTSIEHASDSEREVSLIQSSFIFEKPEDNNFIKGHKEAKQAEPEETFEEFFSRSVSYMCEVIDGKDPKTSRDSKKTHEDQLNVLLDLIIKKINILKKDRDDLSERVSTGKKLLILLDMSLRSMICLIRRKEISVRRLFNKSCGGGKLNEKKNAANEYKLKFEELCGIEEVSNEKNEKDVRDRLCQAILKRKEELGDLEKALKDAKQEITLQYVKVVNIKLCNILKSKTKPQGK